MDHQFFYGLIIGIVVGCFCTHIVSFLFISKKPTRLPAIKPGSAMARVIEGKHDQQSSL